MKIEIKQTITGSERIGKDVQMDVDNGGILLTRQGEEGADEVGLTWPEAAILAAAIQDSLRQIGKFKLGKGEVRERKKPGPKPGSKRKKEPPVGTLLESAGTQEFDLIINKHKHLPCGVKDQGDHGVNTPFEYVWQDQKTHGTQTFPRCAVHSKIYPSGDEIMGFEKNAPAPS